MSALAAMPDGGLAVALAGQEVRVYADPTAPQPRAVFSTKLSAVNALAPTPDGGLIATDGSLTRGVGQWVWDLLERGASGRVLALDPSDGRREDARQRSALWLRRLRDG